MRNSLWKIGNKRTTNGVHQEIRESNTRKRKLKGRKKDNMMRKGLDHRPTA
jgi:hypothetical protein